MKNSCVKRLNTCAEYGECCLFSYTGHDKVVIFLWQQGKDVNSSDPERIQDSSCAFPLVQYSILQNEMPDGSSFNRGYLPLSCLILSVIPLWKSNPVTVAAHKACSTNVILFQSAASH